MDARVNVFMLTALIKAKKKKKKESEILLKSQRAASCKNILKGLDTFYHARLHLPWIAGGLTKRLKVKSSCAVAAALRVQPLHERLEQTTASSSLSALCHRVFFLMAEVWKWHTARLPAGKTQVGSRGLL